MIRGTSSVHAQVVVAKSFGVQIEGYRRAVDRIRAAVAAEDVDGVYISVTEAVNWLTSIADGSNLAGDQDVESLRHARNRSHHQWASIVYHDESGAWFWRPASQLPTDLNLRRAGAKPGAIYTKRLELKPMMEVFDRLAPKVAKARAT